MTFLAKNGCPRSAARPGEEPVALEPIALQVIIPVWGERFVRDFLDVVLPLHQSPENVSALARRPGSAYIVYTRQRDVSLLEREPSFQRMRRLVDTQIRIIPEPISVPHEAMSDCYRDALAKTKAGNVGFVFLAADSIIADGTFGALGALADSGKRCVFVAGPRVVAEGFSAAIRDQRSAFDEAIAIPPREMTKLGLAHLHPISSSHCWDSDFFNTHPSHLYWNIEDEGLLARCFHLHPILVRPVDNVNFRKTIDDDYIVYACPDPETIHIVTDSDEICAFSMTPRDVKIGNEWPHRSSAAYVAWWSYRFTKPEHFTLAEKVVHIHAGRTSPKWKTAEQESIDVLADINIIRSRSNAYLFVFRPDLLIEKSILRKTFIGGRRYKRLLDLRSKARMAVKSHHLVGSLLAIRFALLIESPFLFIPLSVYRLEARFDVVSQIICAVWISRRTIRRRIMQVVRGDRVARARVAWRLRQFGCLLTGRRLIDPQPQE
jgi:hypothetical protein